MQIKNASSVPLIPTRTASRLQTPSLPFAADSCILLGQSPWNGLMPKPSEAPQPAPEDKRLNQQPFRLFHDLRVELDPANSYMVAEDRMSVSRVPDNRKVAFLLHPDLRVKEILYRTDAVPFKKDDNTVTMDLRKLCD